MAVECNEEELNQRKSESRGIDDQDLLVQVVGERREEVPSQDECPKLEAIENGKLERRWDWMKWWWRREGRRRFERSVMCGEFMVIVQLLVHSVLNIMWLLDGVEVRDVLPASTINNEVSCVWILHLIVLWLNHYRRCQELEERRRTLHKCSWGCAVRNTISERQERKESYLCFLISFFFLFFFTEESSDVNPTKAFCIQSLLERLRKTFPLGVNSGVHWRITPIWCVSFLRVGLLIGCGTNTLFVFVVVCLVCLFVCCCVVNNSTVEFLLLGS